MALRVPWPWKLVNQDTLQKRQGRLRSLQRQPARPESQKCRTPSQLKRLKRCRIDGAEPPTQRLGSYNGLWLFVDPEAR